MLQTGCKRPREESEDWEAYERRTKRRAGGDNTPLPALSEEELGKVMCGGLFLAAIDKDIQLELDRT